MKTLIFNGSPRVKGDTAGLINIVTENIRGEYKLVNAYRCDISPCVDCRYCWKNSGCAIKDEMQSVYDYIQECDNIVIASPLYFSELTGKLLDVGSRLQTYFSAGFLRKEKCIEKPKKGAVVLVGGGSGGMDKAYDTACILLHDMNCRDIRKVFCNHTDVTPAVENRQAVEELKDIIRYFNEGEKE